MKHVKLVLLLMVFGLFSLSVHAQYTGPGAKLEYSTVKEVTDNASKLDKQDKQVKLKGFVIEQINNDTFWFKDETGKVQIEIEKKQMPTVPFNEKTEILIIGEVDYDLLEGVEIEVDSLIIKKQ
jgi:uncharacterized protein (TIGR00156 family)